MSSSIVVNTQIGLAADSDSTCYALGNVFVTSKGDAIATTGRIAAVTRIAKNTSWKQTALIPRELFTAKGNVGKSVGIDCEKAGIHIAKKQLVTMPLGEGCMPRLHHVFSEIPKEGYTAISLDTALLHDLGRAVNSPDQRPVVTLFIPLDAERCIYAVGSESNDDDTRGVGIIMPYALGGMEGDAKDRAFYEKRRAELAYLDKEIQTHNDAYAKMIHEREKARATVSPAMANKTA